MPSPCSTLGFADSRLALLVGLAGFEVRSVGLDEYGCRLASEARFAAEVLRGDRLAFIGDMLLSDLTEPAAARADRPPSTSCRQLMICSVVTPWAPRLRDSRRELTLLPALRLVLMLALRPILPNRPDSREPVSQLC